MSTVSLPERMKGYEDCYRYYLPNGFDTIIRVDMRAGHTFTKRFYRPFDMFFMEAMHYTAKVLCENIQNAVMAYTQSDEINILLRTNIETGQSPWFGNNIQKMASIAASTATLYFNKYFAANAKEERHKMAAENGAMFDARVFMVPTCETPNYFLWRFQDAKRNSIQMVAHYLYHHKELVGKKTPELFKMINDKGQDWNSYPADMKYGKLVKKTTARNVNKETEMTYYHSHWEIADLPEKDWYINCYAFWLYFTMG